MKKYTQADTCGAATPEEMKAKLVETLDQLDAFCKEHDLHYCLSGGTLLGAVRHQGFIPWDDDIDVNMPRSDCEKLMELSGGKIGGCILNPPNYEDTTHAYHWKLFNEEILVSKGDKYYPIFIDIFPIEGLPASSFGNWMHYARIKFWKTLADCLWGPKWFHGSTVAARMFHGCMRPVAMLWGKKRLFNHVVKIMKEIPYEASDYVGVMATKVHTTEERVVKKEFAPTVGVSFEGRTFPGPAGYHTYLTQLYGSSYMELPPVEKRFSHHKLVPHKSIYGQRMPGTVKIAVCGLVKSENVGEQFIARSLEYLIQQGLLEQGVQENIQFVEVDLLGRKDNTCPVSSRLEDKKKNYYGYSLYGALTECVFLLLKKLARKLPDRKLQNVCYRARHWIYSHGRNYRKRMLRYFSSKMQDCAFIVVDGAGLLEYCYNEYQEPLLLVSEYAKKNGLDVVYNAIGRAGEYDETDFRSSILRQALRSPVVKFVSARDSLDTVQRCAGENQRVELLADAAFWMKETYPDIVRQNTRAESAEAPLVGIGLIRGDALTGYKVNFGPNQWVQLFAGIARELERRGYRYRFFTNGLPGDVVLGKAVLAELGLPEEAMVRRPRLDTELYGDIAGFDGLITCRMHSAIAAFTLRIPSVILSWNDKVNKLMDHVGYSERAINLENFEPVYIVDCFERAMQEGAAEEKLGAMKEKAKRSVDGYIDLLAEAVSSAASAEMNA